VKRAGDPTSVGRDGVGSRPTDRPIKGRPQDNNELGPVLGSKPTGRFDTLSASSDASEEMAAKTDDLGQLLFGAEGLEAPTSRLVREGTSLTSSLSDIAAEQRCPVRRSGPYPMVIPARQECPTRMPFDRPFIGAQIPEVYIPWT
jgi:hypothetical protein